MPTLLNTKQCVWLNFKNEVKYPATKFNVTGHFPQRRAFLYKRYSHDTCPVWLPCCQVALKQKFASWFSTSRNLTVPLYQKYKESSSVLLSIADAFHPHIFCGETEGKQERYQNSRPFFFFFFFEIQTRNLSSKDKQRQSLNSDIKQTFYYYFLISPSGIICADIYLCTLRAGSANLPCSIVYPVKLTAANITIQSVPAHLCCSDPSQKFVQIRNLA